MLNNILMFIVALFLVIQGATMATKYASALALHFRLSKYVIGFIVVAFVSILPETTISINAALEGIPEFGLGTLFGSNVADLTLVFAILIIVAGRKMNIESKLLKKIPLYPLFLLTPLLLGVDGFYSRLDGILLIIIGVAFYYLIFRNSIELSKVAVDKSHTVKHVLLFLGAMALLLIGSHFTLSAATAIAASLGISPIIIGMLIVGVGTTMPELFFSLKSMRHRDDGLAVGDILGAALADATIVVGVISCISPFAFPISIVYLTGGFMVVAAIMLIVFMRSGRVISKKEGYALLVFWVIYVIAEYTLGH